MFDHLLESSRWDDSNKWSNIVFGEKIDMIEIKMCVLSGSLAVGQYHYWLSFPCCLLLTICFTRSVLIPLGREVLNVCLGKMENAVCIFIGEKIVFVIGDTFSFVGCTFAMCEGWSILFIIFLGRETYVFIQFVRWFYNIRQWIYVI